MLVLGVIIIVLGGLYAALGLYQAVTDRAIWSVLQRLSRTSDVRHNGIVAALAGLVWALIGVAFLVDSTILLVGMLTLAIVTLVIIVRGPRSRAV